jgi:FMN phosphatase YigB (HAD superfamily)
MSATAHHTRDLRSALEHPTRGVVGLVDDLLKVCLEHGLQLDWQADRYRVRSLGGDWEELIDVPLRKSVFRAILARIAALCNEQCQNSISPYGGQGELSAGANSSTVFRVTFVNTTAEQKLVLLTATELAVEASQRPGPIERPAIKAATTVGSADKPTVAVKCGMGSHDVNASQIIGIRRSEHTKDAIKRIIAGAGELPSGFLCIAAVAHKELFGPIDSVHNLWPDVQNLLQKHDVDLKRIHDVRVLFLDPDSPAAHTREIFETKPNRSVPVFTRAAIRTTLGQARLFRNSNRNLHIRLAPEMPCCLFFNQNEMLSHPYLSSAVGPETEVTWSVKGSNTYENGECHFENHWQSRWVLFDFGNVLVNFDHALISAKLWEYLAKSNAPPTPMPTRELIHSFFFDSRGKKPSRNVEIELGRHNIEWLRTEFCDWSGGSIGPERFQDIWNSIFGRMSCEAIQCVQELQRMGIFVGICSNTNASHWDRMCADYGGLIDAVNASFCSFKLHTRKPDYKFFESICESTKAPPWNHILIDDLVENVSGARAAGMQSDIFRGFPEVLELVQNRFWNSQFQSDVDSATGLARRCT